ncbi:MAG TPA: DUF4340 domain-containing protein [Gemmatimonadales bacterium]|nr:DUF4340 domain-containing protein [Gemmatimonadales bacterium]
MSAKQLKLIAIGLGVLLLLWGGSELLSRGSDSVTGTLMLPALPAGDVDTIRVVQRADSILLVKRPPAEWGVNGHRVTPDAVAELLQALHDSVRPEVVAQDTSSFARLGVDSVGGRWLSVRAGTKQSLTLIVGTRGRDYQSTYLRRPGDPHVYLWRTPLANLVDRSADDWRDKRIAALPPDSVVAIDVDRPKDRYTLQQTGKKWTLQGHAADSAAVARYLDRLKTITAAGFASRRESDSTKAVRGKRRLTVRGAYGVLLSLAFDSTASVYLVRHLAGAGGEGTTVYRMNSWDVDGLAPASRTLLPTKK